MDKQEKTEETNTEFLSARTVLWILVFIGFGVNYMTRINLNIAIVSMVKQRPKHNLALSSECLAQSLNSSVQNYSTAFLLSTKAPDKFYNSTNLNETERNAPKSTKYIDTYLTSTTVAPKSSKTTDYFDWDEKIQGYVLGSYYWLHWLTQIPGGILASRYGTKAVFGLSNFAGVLLSFGMPWAAYTGYQYLIFLRVVQGLVCGFTWPSAHNMTARWIPPNERSKFVTAYLGSSVGVAVTYPLCGWIIDRWGWPYVFHVCGGIGLVWFVAWWCLVHDSPSQHPRISEKEKEYILTALGSNVAVAKERPPVPWKSIFTNITVWCNAFAQWGGVWGMFTLMTHAPTYFKFIHGWNIKATGLLSGMPHLLRWMWAYVFSVLGDYLLRTGKMSRSNVRKLATAVCCIGQGCFMLGLAYSGCNRMTAIVFMTLATASHGAVSTGPLASVVDISPNYAGVILGMLNTIVSMAGFVIPIIVGNLTFRNQTVGQWQKVFWIASSLLFSSGVFYVCFSKSELQPWNKKAKEPPESEMAVFIKNDSARSNAGDNKNGYEKVTNETADEK